MPFTNPNSLFFDDLDFLLEEFLPQAETSKSIIDLELQKVSPLLQLSPQDVQGLIPLELNDNLQPKENFPQQSPSPQGPSFGAQFHDASGSSQTLPVGKEPEESTPKKKSRKTGRPPTRKSPRLQELADKDREQLRLNQESSRNERKRLSREFISKALKTLDMFRVDIIKLRECKEQERGEVVAQPGQASFNDVISPETSDKKLDIVKEKLMLISTMIQTLKDYVTSIGEY